MKTLMNLELAEFCNQMHLMLASGISSFESLTLLLDDTENQAEKELLQLMLDKITETGYFYDAVIESKVFPNYAENMIRLGEETGTLDKVMAALSVHYTREYNISAMLKSALVYPTIMLGMMFLVILVLLTKVMPVFEQVFMQLGQEMSGFSLGLLRMGETLKAYGLVFIVIVIIIAILCYTQRHKLPFQRKLQEQIATCRFSDGMSIALKSGLTPENGLDLAETLVENDVLENKIQECKNLLENGTALHDALKDSKIYTGSYARLIRIAGKSGSLDETLEHIASEYEHAAQSKIHSLIGILEPTLVIILSLVVGIILFSVMLPLLGIMSSL